MSDVVFTSAFLIVTTPEMTVKGDWVEFISSSGDGKIRRYMTREAARGMVEILGRLLAEADTAPSNVVPIWGGHSQPL